MTKWQPIETAPKDGTEVLTLSSAASVEMVRNSFWDDEEEDWFYYTSTFTSENFDMLFKPTHWMPLPPPPPEDYP